MLLTPALHIRQGTSLIQHLRNLHLTGSLQFALDVGDGNCYPGAGQPVLDLSGAAYDFTRGFSAAVEASADPVFIGTVGGEGAAEYLRFPDQGYVLTSPVTTFANSLHKHGALFSFACWARISQLDLVNGGTIVRTNIGKASVNDPFIGIGLGNSTANPPSSFGFTAAISDAFAAVNIETGILGVPDEFAFYGFTLNEPAGVWTAQVNSDVTNGGGGYVNPNATDIVGGIFYGPSNDPAGGYSMDIAQSAMWSRALAPGELNAIYQATRSRYA